MHKKSWNDPFECKLILLNWYAILKQRATADMDRRMALMSKTSSDQDRYQLEMDRLRIEIEKLKDKSERSQGEVNRLQAKIDVDDQEKRQRDRLASNGEKQREDLVLEAERLRDRYAKLQLDYERVGQEKERADSTVRSYQHRFHNQFNN